MDDYAKSMQDQIINYQHKTNIHQHSPSFKTPYCDGNHYSGDLTFDQNQYKYYE